MSLSQDAQSPSNPRPTPALPFDSAVASYNNKYQVVFILTFKRSSVRSSDQVVLISLYAEQIPKCEKLWTDGEGLLQHQVAGQERQQVADKNSQVSNLGVVGVSGLSLI